MDYYNIRKLYMQSILCMMSKLKINVPSMIGEIKQYEVGGGQPHFTSFYLIPILPFLAARMR